MTSGTQSCRELILREWQRDIIRGLYATDATGARLVRAGVVSMARRAGRSTLASALALAHLLGPEAVPRGQVVSAAAERGQAAIIFRGVVAFARANPEIAERLNIRQHDKTIVDTGSTFAALWADARKAHGLSPTFAIADEVARGAGGSCWRRCKPAWARMPKRSCWRSARALRTPTTSSRS